jgi:hypothetical protein
MNVLQRIFNAFTAVAAAVFLGLSAQTAWASSVSFSSINFGAITDSGTTSSFVTDLSGNNSAGSLVFPTVGTLKAKTVSDGTANDLFTGSSHSDDWTCTGGCDALLAPVGMSATIGFDFDVTGNVGFLDLKASYTIGSDSFVFEAGADSTPIAIGKAEFDGVPVDVNVFPDSKNPSITHFETFFTRPFTICPCIATNAPFVSDVQAISLEMTGNATVDASHTFTVTLTPDDPNLVLTSTDGRVAAAAPVSAVPEPATLSLTLLGLAGVARRSWHRRVK